MPTSSWKRRVPARVLRLGRDVRASLWFQPFALALAGAVVGEVLPRIDRMVFDEQQSLERAISPEGASNLLSVSATTLAALLAVGFSIATVTVQLAASQYSPRLLRRFMSDATTKRVLGAFTATLTYLLLVMRTVRGAGPGEYDFVPYLSVVLATLATVLCVALLPFFLHHVTRSIQVATIVASVGKDGARVLHGMDFGSEDVTRQAPAAAVVTDGTGYLQVLHEQQLVEALPEWCEAARAEVAVGEFILPGTQLVSLWPVHEVSGEVRRRIHAAFGLSRERNIAQDVLFGVQQLVDVALKALSPGVNDATTALMALNELGAVNVAAVRAGVPGNRAWAVVHRENPVLAVRMLDLETLVRSSFDPVILAARQQPGILLRLLEILEHAARTTPEDHRALVFIRAGDRVRQVTAGIDAPDDVLDALEQRLLNLSLTRTSEVVPGRATIQ